MPGSRLRQTGTFIATHLHHRMPDVTLARRKTCFREGGGARPKGVAPSSAQVWMMCTALAEPIRITLPRRPWRARCPPGRHVRSGAPTRALQCSPDRVGVASRSSEGVTVPPEGARVAAEAKTPRQWSVVWLPEVGRNGSQLQGTPLQSCSRYSAGVMWGRPAAHRTRTTPGKLGGVEPAQRTEPGCPFRWSAGFLLIRKGSAIQRGGAEHARTRRPIHLSTRISAGTAVLPSSTSSLPSPAGQLVA